MSRVFAKAIPAYLAVFLGMVLLASCSGRSQGQGSDIPVAAKGDAVKIGICMPSDGPWAHLSGYQSIGIRMAGELLKEKTGRNIELISRDPGTCPRETVVAVRDLLMEDKVSGIISCMSVEEAVAVQEMLSRNPVPFIATAPCSGGKLKEGQRGVRICTSLEDQAYACARFLSDELKTKRIGLVVAVDDPVIVRLASLFSSELIKTHSRIVDVAYVKKGVDPAPSLVHLMEEKPDAVYIPFFGASAFATVAKLRSIDENKPILISPLQGEEDILGRADNTMMGVYIQTDFIEEAVVSPLGREFLEYRRKHGKFKDPFSAAMAVGAEACFLTLDMISEARKSTMEGSLQAAASWEGPLLGMKGVTPKGAVYKRLLFGKIEKRFLGSATVKHVASVSMIRSDPVADVGTQ